MKRRSMLPALLLLIAGSTAWSQTRPHNPWVERFITAERSRQLSVALHQDLWVMYDLPAGALYMAWRGGAAGGALRSAGPDVSPGYWFNGGPHFPHIYVPAGTAYFKDAVGEYFSSWTKPADITTYYTKWPAQPRNYQAWSVYNGAQQVAAKVRYRGFSTLGNKLVLRLSLALPDGKEIAVTDSPEYSAASSRTNLVRTLTFGGIPAGHEVRLNRLIGGTAAWSATGGTVQGTSLIQAADGQTTLTGSWN